MDKKMTWEQIKKTYPDQWVSLLDVEKDDKGAIISAVVVAFGPDLKVVTQKLKAKNCLSDRTEFTGKIKRFLGFAKWEIEENLHASSAQ